MAVVLSALNGQSSWARHYLRRTTDEVDWNHRVDVEAQVLMTDITIEPEYNGSKFPEPVMYLTGKVQEMEGDFGYGIKRVAFGSEMRGAEEPDVRIRWAFTPEEAAQLYRLGLHTDDFEIPKELTGITYSLPMQAAVDTVVPRMGEQSVPVMVVHIIDEGAVPMDTQKSGYYRFVEQYMQPSQTMREHAQELSAFNRSFHSDIEAYFGMRALENSGVTDEVDDLFDLSEDVQDAVGKVTEDRSVAEKKAQTPEKSLAADIMASMGEDAPVVAGYGDDGDTVEDIIGVDGPVSSSIADNFIDVSDDHMMEDESAAEELFADMFDDDEDESEEAGKDEASIDAAELARRNARRRAAEEAISEPEIVPVEVDVPEEKSPFVNFDGMDF